MILFMRVATRVKNSKVVRALTHLLAPLIRGEGQGKGLSVVG